MNGNVAVAKHLLHKINVIVTTLCTLIGFMKTNRRRIISVIWTVEGKNYEISFSKWFLKLLNMLFLHCVWANSTLLSYSLRNSCLSARKSFSTNISDTEGTQQKISPYSVLSSFSHWDEDLQVVRLLSSQEPIILLAPSPCYTPLIPLISSAGQGRAQNPDARCSFFKLFSGVFQP